MRSRDLLLLALGLVLAAWGLRNFLEPYPVLFCGHSREQLGSVVVSPDGTLLAAVAENPAIRTSRDKSRGAFCTIKLWEVASRKELATLQGHSCDVWSLVFSPDNQLLASASHDEGSIRLWKVATGQQQAVLRGQGKISQVLFSPDGRTLAAVDDSTTVRFWDVATQQQLPMHLSHGESIFCLAFSPDGKLLATGGDMKTMKIWDLGTGRERATLHKEPEWQCMDWFRCVAFSPAGKLLAAGNNDTEIWLWDVATGQRLSVLGKFQDEDYIEDLVFSPDGQTLAALSTLRDRLELWDVTTGFKLAIHPLRKHTAVDSLHMDPEGRLMVLETSPWPNPKTAQLRLMTQCRRRR